MQIVLTSYRDPDPPPSESDLVDHNEAALTSRRRIRLDGPQREWFIRIRVGNAVVMVKAEELRTAVDALTKQ